MRGQEDPGRAETQDVPRGAVAGLGSAYLSCAPSLDRMRSSTKMASGLMGCPSSRRLWHRCCRQQKANLQLAMWARTRSGFQKYTGPIRKVVPVGAEPLLYLPEAPVLAEQSSGPRLPCSARGWSVFHPGGRPQPPSPRRSRLRRP